MNAYLVTLLVYSGGLILLGLILGRTVKDSQAFFVAGRQLGPGLLFSTILAANIGAGSTVGAAGLGFSVGLVGWWWVGSAGIGSLVLAAAIGPKIRALAERLDFLTLGDYLEHRYGASVRVVVAALLWVGSLAILAGQLIAFAWILQVVAGTDKSTGCLVGGVVVLVYFTAGGLKGAAWVNALQLIVKGAGFLLSIPFAWAAVGGWAGLEAAVLESGRRDEFLALTGSGWDEVLPYLVLLVPSFIVSPGLLQKVYGARDGRAVRLGVGTNALALLVFSFFPVGLGLTAAVLYPHLAHAELALPTVITSVLPMWLGALLLAAVFSAEVSSADAILFMLSTSLTRDLYQRFLRPRSTDAEVLRMGRAMAVLSGLAGIVAALLLDSVIEALKVFYGLLSVSLFVPVVIGLYRARPGGRTCLVAVVASLSAALVFHLLTGGSGWGPLSPTAFGILTSLAIFLAALRQRR